MQAQENGTRWPPRHAGPDLKLTPSDLKRLVGALNLLGSDRPGERDAAGLAAARIVQSRGLTWADLIQPPSLAPPQPEPRPCAAADLALCGRHYARLSAWETSFIIALSQWHGQLSPAQVRKLATIAARLRSEGCA